MPTRVRHVRYRRDSEVGAPDGGHGERPYIALGHRILDFDGAVDRVYDASELDDGPVAGALDRAPVMHGDRWINQVAAEGLRRARTRSSSAPTRRQ